MTTGNSSLDTPFTFYLSVNPNNGLFPVSFGGAPCVSLTSNTFFLAVSLSLLFGVENLSINPPRKILPSSFSSAPSLSVCVYCLSATFRVFLGEFCNNPIFVRFILLFIYTCLYVLNCLCVYFGWDYYNSVLEGYFGHFVSKGKLVISL